MSGLYVLKMLWGIIMIYICGYLFHIYTVLIKWLVAYKCGYRSYIKQVIISYEFCQHFHCLEVVLVFMDDSVVFRYFGACRLVFKPP